MPLDRTGRRATRIAKMFIDFLWVMGLIGLVAMPMILVAAPVAGTSRIRVFVEVDERLPAPGVALPQPNAPGVSRPSLEPPEHARRLAFDTTRPSLFWLANWYLLPVFVVLVAGLRQLRTFLADVLRERVFTRENANRLGRLGWLLIGLGFGLPAVEHWTAVLVLRLIQLPQAAIEAGSSGSTGGLVLGGLLTLVLAAAWRYGAELQLERDLTV